MDMLNLNRMRIHPIRFLIRIRVDRPLECLVTDIAIYGKLDIILEVKYIYIYIYVCMY